jgi:hypothetical protein
MKVGFFFMESAELIILILKSNLYLDLTIIREVA